MVVIFTFRNGLLPFLLELNRWHSFTRLLNCYWILWIIFSFYFSFPVTFGRCYNISSYINPTSHVMGECHVLFFVTGLIIFISNSFHENFTRWTRLGRNCISYSLHYITCLSINFQLQYFHHFNLTFADIKISAD